jgi:hypothetical protein
MLQDMTVVEYAQQDGGWHDSRSYTWTNRILVRRRYCYCPRYYDSCMDSAVGKSIHLVVAKPVGDGVFRPFLWWYQQAAGNHLMSVFGYSWDTMAKLQ